MPFSLLGMLNIVDSELNLSLKVGISCLLGMLNIVDSEHFLKQTNL